MVSKENLLNVIANIYGINILTRNKMMGAVKRDEMDTLMKFLNGHHDHIPADVQVVLLHMVNNLR